MMPTHVHDFDHSEESLTRDQNQLLLHALRTATGTMRL